MIATRGVIVSTCTSVLVVLRISCVNVPGKIEIDMPSLIYHSLPIGELEKSVPSLTIPTRLRAGLAALGSLSSDCYETLFKALKDADPADTAKALAARIENKFPESSRSSIEKIIVAINSSQSVQRSAHVDAEEFVSDAWEALKEDSPKLLEGIDRETFQSRLGALINETDIQLTTSKIRQLRTEVERSMCGARIITDVRPAFMHDATRPPKAATILHTLQIRFHDDGDKHREFYVAVDDNDLNILKEAIERAIAKEKTLKELFGGTQLQFFE